MAETAFRSIGKQVLRGADHFADAASETAAKAIVTAMNTPDWLDAEADRCRHRGTARAWRIAADNIRAGLNEGMA